MGHLIQGSYSYLGLDEEAGQGEETGEEIEIQDVDTGKNFKRPKGGVEESRRRARRMNCCVMLGWQ